ncbi:hypothetical protein P0082_10430 [Candidatus Haliotispira prima]|uniref:GNAT family N-acetyltransferase n=1 Tax=Candidatus Haliotispira prima TaxID=3034016 RepID=A0ABY8MI89_9SPIO|nr:hypothetical protein P0082_10430 [Candidatus Haliotispira prima]
MPNPIKKFLPSPLLRMLQQYKGQRQTVQQGRGQSLLLNDFLRNCDLGDTHRSAFARYYLGYGYRVFHGHFIKAWQLRHYFPPEQRNLLKKNDFLVYLRLSNMAVLPLSDGPEATEVFLHKRIGPKGRNMLRKAEKIGYSVRPISYDEHLDDIFTVNTSKRERQGRAMSAAYLAYPVKRSEPLYKLGIEYHSFGSFHEGSGELVAYAGFYRFGNVFRIDKVLGHSKHLTYGIMNQLFAQVAILLSEDYPGSCLNYLTMNTIGDFKARLGFEPHNMLLGLPDSAAVKKLIRVVRHSEVEDWEGDWAGRYIERSLSPTGN